MISNISISPCTQVNYETVISGKSKKIHSITVTTDLDCGIYVKQYDENLVIELTNNVITEYDNDLYKNNSFRLNEGNILDYWSVSADRRSKTCRDKVFITNYAKDKNVVFNLYGVLNDDIKKIGTVAVSEKYVTTQAFLDVSKIEKYSEFIIVPQNNKKYIFYASSKHGDLYIYYEDEADV